MIYKNLDLDIIPSYSIGEFIIGTTFNEYKDIIKKHGKVIKEEFPSKLYKKYSIYNGIIELLFEVNTSKLILIIANEGYSGKLNNNIYIGLKIGSAIELNRNIYWDDDDAICRINNIDGVSIVLEDLMFDLDENPQNKIYQIVVFDKAILG